DIPIDCRALQSQLNGSFYSSTNRRIYLVNEQGALIQFEGCEAVSALSRRYGSFFDDLELESIVETPVRRLTDGKTEY
ncbi:hypothetical protein, partial [Vibrio parahaemolyticus]|uniref:hypothetical protein n=1 Tax=Vibrio parahaemolyticus TaxID=670 RepID=UPI001C608427